jgi:BolA protein
MPSRKERIMSAIAAQMDAQELEVVDDSHRHAGHTGAQPEGETHYKVHVVASAFDGLNAVARHRKINAILANEFECGLHALNITARTPQELAARV